MRRELAIVLAAPVTWAIAAAIAFIAGHSFVLGLDIFSGASQPAADGTLMNRGLEPLAGIVAPTLGGVDFCVTLLGAVVVVRAIAVDRERRTLHATLLHRGAVASLLGRKWTAACAGLALALAAPGLLVAGWLVVGGHLGAAETAVAFAGTGLHLVVVAAIGCAAAAWTRTFGAAVAVALAVCIGSWIVDGVAEFAALSWLAPLAGWSLSPHLRPFQDGVLAVGDVGWLAMVAASSLAVAYFGLRVDLPGPRRAAGLALVVGIALASLVGLDHYERGWDLSQSRRSSLPDATVSALHEIEGPIVIDVWLDREDGRRHHVERDALARLRLAVDDVIVRFPLDDAPHARPTIRDEDYGLIAITVGTTTLSTRSTARRELTTLTLEAAGAAVPPWHDPAYEGHPFAVSAAVRRLLMLVAYLGIPLALLGVAAWLRWRP
jgi:hypothetical protein